MALSETENGIILGAQLAGGLGIYSSADLSVTPLGSLLARNLADTKGVTVVGFADFGAYGNSDTALVNLAQAQQLFATNSASRLQLRLRVDDVFSAKAIAEELFAAYPDLIVQSWDEAQASLFNALRMEKVLTSFMLLMIVMVGAVNIVSTLVMVVADKGADVAILRTMGASRSTIMKIFRGAGTGSRPAWHADRGGTGYAAGRQYHRYKSHTGEDDQFPGERFEPLFHFPPADTDRMD